MSKTTFKKRIPHTEVIEAQRRAAGETWTCLADGYHYLYEKFDYSLSKGNAAALFATAKMTTRVREALRDLPFTLPETVFELDSNPLVSKIMRRTGVQQRQQVIRRFYIHLNGFFEALDIWKENGREGTRPRPPYRRVRYARVDWVHTRLKKITGGDEDSDDSNAGSTRTGDTLVLQTTRGEPQIRVDWPHPEPQSVQLIMEAGRPSALSTTPRSKIYRRGFSANERHEGIGSPAWIWESPASQPPTTERMLSFSRGRLSKTCGPCKIGRSGDLRKRWIGKKSAPAAGRSSQRRETSDSRHLETGATTSSTK